MGVSRKRRRKGREEIPTRFALTRKATSPFQGEVEAPIAECVARMKRSEIRERYIRR